MIKFTKKNLCLVLAITLAIVLILFYIFICIYNFKLIDNCYVNKLFYIIVTAATAFILYFQKEANKKLAKDLSFKYMKRWMEEPIKSSKKVVELKLARKLKELKSREEIKKCFSNEEVLKNDKAFELRANAYDCCNFFEEIAIAIKHDIVDEEILKDYFEGIVKDYFDTLRVFIETQRELDNDNGIFIEFEKLKDNWH